MSKKDYEKAAQIAQGVPFEIGGVAVEGYSCRDTHEAIVEAFVELFRDDNPLFDAARFRRACVPGANVKARKAS